MIVYVLTKRYYDNSGFDVCGVTAYKPVAQAFYAGGCDATAVSEVYAVDTDEPIKTVDDSYKVIDWQKECYEDENSRDHPEPVPVTPSASISDDDIPF